MNWFIARLKEPSTKRGIIWLIAGVAILFGYEVSPEKIEQWIGIAMMIAGLLGWLPDEPKKLVEKSGSRRSDDDHRNSAQSGTDAHFGITHVDYPDGVQPAVPTSSYAKTESTEPSQSGWNG